MAKKKDEIGGAATGEETPPESKPETTPEAEKPPEETGLKPPPEEEVFTYTKKERDEFVTAEKAAIGRQLRDSLAVNATLKKRMDGQGTTITGLESTVQSVRAAARERELSDAAGSTEVVDAIKLKHKNEDESLKLSKERSDFTEEKARYQADLDKLAETEATNLAKELATESGLTADLILQIGSDQDGDGRIVYNLERMKTIASKSPKGEEEEEESEGKVTTPVKGLRAKAGSTGRAATGLRTWPDYEAAFVAGEISREEYGKAAKRFNIQL